MNGARYGAAAMRSETVPRCDTRGRLWAEIAVARGADHGCWHVCGAEREAALFTRACYEPWGELRGMCLASGRRRAVMCRRIGSEDETGRLGGAARV